MEWNRSVSSLMPADVFKAESKCTVLLSVNCWRYYTVNHFDVYLRGPPIVIRTDHASLRYIKTLRELLDFLERRHIVSLCVL